MLDPPHDKSVDWIDPPVGKFREKTLWSAGRSKSPKVHIQRPEKPFQSIRCMGIDPKCPAHPAMDGGVRSVIKRNPIGLPIPESLQNPVSG